MAVKLVVDSASDIDLKEAEALGIHMIPMSIQFGDTTYADGIDLSGPAFFEKLIESSELPTTSQITMYQFEECFAELTAFRNLCGSRIRSTVFSGKSVCGRQSQCMYWRADIDSICDSASKGRNFCGGAGKEAFGGTEAD